MGSQRNHRHPRGTQVEHDDLDLKHLNAPEGGGQNGEEADAAAGGTCGQAIVKFEVDSAAPMRRWAPERLVMCL
jgi:hypothetical protein